MEKAIKIEHVSKMYRLGTIGGGTLRGDLQSWWAKKRGKEDPNSIIGSSSYMGNEKFLALNDISLVVNKGDAIGIIGHNGAGKSTLLKLLSQVTAPSDGKIYLNGRIASMLEVGTGFHPELTGRENVYMNGTILGMSKREIDKKMEQIIEFSEVGQFIDTPVKRYSSGMYVKLAFSVAAHLDSEILIMDEVLAVGDLAFQQKCLNKMKDVAENEGRTVLYVSHNMNTIQQLCNRCIVLDHGTVKYDGDVNTAVSIYADMSNYLKCYQDYSDFKRKYRMYAYDLFLLSAEFSGKKTSSFYRNEPMVLKLKWRNENDVAPIGLRYEIRTSTGTPLCTYMLDGFYQGKKGSIVSAEFEVDISDLVPGQYRGTYTFFYKNQYGDAGNVDCVPGLGFEILAGNDENCLKWDSQNWGWISMKEPHILTIEDNYEETR